MKQRLSAGACLALFVTFAMSIYLHQIVLITPSTWSQHQHSLKVGAVSSTTQSPLRQRIVSRESDIAVKSSVESQHTNAYSQSADTWSNDHCLSRDRKAYRQVNMTLVDVVFTHVNSHDPEWRASFDQHYHNGAEPIFNRYRDWGELRYAMRSVFQHASWVRRVYLVVSSPQQVPAWLNTSVVRVVYHHQLFDDPAHQLPTFNSLAIESVLHRIPGLSQLFLYFNNGALPKF
jgi:hypothetical protein